MTKTQLLAVYDALTQLIYQSNIAAEDDDRGPDNAAFCLTLWDDGSGRLGVRRFVGGNADSVLDHHTFDDVEDLVQALVAEGIEVEPDDCPLCHHLWPALQSCSACGPACVACQRAVKPLARARVVLPGLRLESENHRYAKSLRATMRQKKAVRHTVYYQLVSDVGAAWAHQHAQRPMTVTLTRIAPYRMDKDDGLPSAFKGIKDIVAGFLVGKPNEGHRYDDHLRFTWRYAQRKGTQPREYSVEIVLEVY